MNSDSTDFHDSSAQHLDVAVVGGGQAGLAIGYFLSQQGRRFVILERANEIAPAWRERWDSLTLFTPRRYSALPGLPFPGDPDGYPTRDEVIAYLEHYAESFGLPVELNSDVKELNRGGDGGFRLEAGGRAITADQIVVATGPFQTPYVPEAQREALQRSLPDPAVGYREPGAVPTGTVLVVGGGNTGFQIAKELSATHKVVLSIGSQQKPLPQRVLGRDLFWWLTKTRLLNKTVDSRIGRKLGMRDTLIGSSPREMTKRYGVQLKPRLVDAEGRRVRFADGSELEVDAVIWATGYRSDYSWIELPILGEDGRVRHRRGVTDVPGLYFLGLTWQHTRGSALIGLVKDDAEFIAEQDRQYQREDEPRTPAAVGAGRSQQEPPSERSVSRCTSTSTRDNTSPSTSDFPTDTERPSRRAPPRASSSSPMATTFELRIAPVEKRIGDATVRMLAYNGSIPGPTLKVPQGATVTVHVTNEGDLEATVHWHGLRLENRYDGTHDTQAPIPVGETFTYQVHVPGPRRLLVPPAHPRGLRPGDGAVRQHPRRPGRARLLAAGQPRAALTLDDVLIEDGKIAGFSASETTHVAMGRFGNVMLVAGEPTSHSPRSAVRSCASTSPTPPTHACSTSTLPGARMKLVGGDSGHYEHESFVDEVLLSPSERFVVDVLFEHRASSRSSTARLPASYRLATIAVSDEPAVPALAEQFDVLRNNAEMAAERERLAPYLTRRPTRRSPSSPRWTSACPRGRRLRLSDAPDVVSDEPGSCPKCGMKLLATAAPTSYVCPMHPEVTATPDRCPKCGMKLLPAELVDAGTLTGTTWHGTRRARTTSIGKQSRAGDHGHARTAHNTTHAHGIEWEDDMVEVNRLTTPANMRWTLVDRETGAENAQIDWTFRVGTRSRSASSTRWTQIIRCPHPFHVHGAGRFLVLTRDGVEEPNLVWKDTVLVCTGETVDILLDVTNPGRWMAHCHIAEHHESGMMFSFNVE